MIIRIVESMALNFFKFLHMQQFFKSSLGFPRFLFKKNSFASYSDAPNFTQGSASIRRRSTNFFWPFAVTSLTAACLLVYFVEEKKKLESKSKYRFFRCV